MSEARTSPPALSVTGVGHSFGRVEALSDVSLEVPEGRFAALLGINGAGKTTLFSLVTRLYDNVSGSIRVCGHDVRRSPGPALARIGVVFQSRAVDADLTVRQNLVYHGALHGMTRAETEARATEVLERVRLSDRLDDRVSALSGGQLRRVEIARALIHRPRLLLLDEATAGLDVKSRREVLAAVRRLVSAEGVGVLWATHLFDEIEPGDSIVLLHRGRVIDRGKAREIAGERGLIEVFLERTGLEAEDVGA